MKMDTSERSHEDKFSGRHRARPGAAAPSYDVLTLERLRVIGVILYGRRWQDRLASEAQFDKSVIQRMMSGSQRVPNAMPYRVREVAARRITEIADTLTLVAHVANFATIERVGRTLFGSAWKGDLAEVCAFDASMMTLMAQGKRSIPVDMSARMHDAVVERMEEIAEVLTQPGLPQRTSPTTRLATEHARAAHRNARAGNIYGAIAAAHAATAVALVDGPA